MTDLAVPTAGAVLPRAMALSVSSSSDLFLRIHESFWCPKKPWGWLDIDHEHDGAKSQ